MVDFEAMLSSLYHAIFTMLTLCSSGDVMRDRNWGSVMRGLDWGALKR
jgi:hypothetical protein